MAVRCDEQGHEKLWIFIKQSWGTECQHHMGWDEGMIYRSEYAWVPAYTKDLEKNHREAARGNKDLEIFWR